jgi:hypothetical protein
VWCVFSVLFTLFILLRAVDVFRFRFMAQVDHSYSIMSNTSICTSFALLHICFPIICHITISCPLFRYFFFSSFFFFLFSHSDAYPYSFPYIIKYPIFQNPCFSAHRSGTDLVKVAGTDLYYSTYFFDIAFSDDDVNENVNYDSDYEESMLLSANYRGKLSGIK